MASGQTWLTGTGQTGLSRPSQARLTALHPGSVRQPGYEPSFSMLAEQNNEEISYPQPRGSHIIEEPFGSKVTSLLLCRDPHPELTRQVNFG